MSHGWEIVSVVTTVCAAAPAAMYFRNLFVYRPLAKAGAGGGEAKVSVLIPARNEAGAIAEAVESALQEGVMEVVVLDDQSTDRTAEIVRGIAARDGRARVEMGRELPAGWCGKQFACFTLGQLARGDLLLFLDADVRLEAGAVGRISAFMAGRDAALASGFPRQVTVGLLEKMLIPLMHFLLLGFLPMGRMRASAHLAYAAGCGQLFVARAKEYRRIDGHGLVKGSLHDGITLPRAYRERGLKTDLFDATDVARCRMYRTGAQVWGGLMKNATEGLASAKVIVPATVMLLAGQVGPFAMLVVELFRGNFWGASGAAMGCVLVLAVRLDAAFRFRQTVLGALLQPVDILLLLVVQWGALLKKLLGRKAEWKGRRYG